jgi:predicted RNA-binding Zn-ribbon protein involved in translation (DUF1610 family)
MKDKTGYEIPPTLETDWKAAEQFQNMLTTLQRVKLYVEKAVNDNDLIFREIGQDTYIDISNAITSLKRVLPFAVCPTCQGRIRERCTTCRQRGFISKFIWDVCVPLETKQIRERAVVAATVQQ